MVDRIRADAKYVAEHAQSVSIDDEAIGAFVASLDRAQFATLSTPTEFPLQFTEQSRVNFECVKDILEFGSGWRTMLKQVHGKGAHETIITGVFSLYISGDLNAAKLASLSLMDVGQLFDLPIDVERPVALDGIVTEFVEHPVRPLVMFLKRVLNESGEILQRRGCEDFYQLICRELKPSAASPVPAARLVDMLRGVFPAFNDVSSYGDRQVHLLKKAQLLACDLQHAHRAGVVSWDVTGCDELTVFPDNVLPCVLRKLGVLVLDEALAARIDAGKILPTGREEVELRALTVEACERIVARSNGDIKARDLDMYLWRLGKEKEYRGLERHYTQNTVFY